LILNTRISLAVTSDADINTACEVRLQLVERSVGNSKAGTVARRRERRKVFSNIPKN